MADEFVYVRNAQTGAIGRMAAAEFHADPQNFIKQGLVPIPQADVPAAVAERRAAKLQEAQETERRAQAATLPGMVATAGEGVATGAFDAATALPRAASAIGAHVAGKADPLADMTGRNLLETGAYTAGGGGVQGAQAARDYAANARARATENQVTSTASNIGGQILGAGGLSAIGKGAGAALTGKLGSGALARVAGSAAATGIEGGALNLVSAQDQAYIENRKLTGEQALSAIGTGTLLGAGLGAVGKGLGEVFGAAKAKVGEMVAARRAGTAGAEAVATGAEGAAEKEAAGKLAGAKESDLARTFKGATGQEALPETPDLIKQGFKNHGDLSGVREAAHSEAAEKIATAINDSNAATEKLARKVSDKTWKLDQVAQKAETFAPDALEQTQARSAALKADIRETIEGLGKDAPKSLKGLADRLEAADLTIRGTTNVAKANIVFDQVRRDLHTTSQIFQKSIEGGGNADARALNMAMAERIGGHYDDAANFLMDDAVWGAQGKAQKAVNTAFPDFIQAKKYAQPEFSKQVGEDYLGRGRVTPDVEAHEGKILGAVEKFGTTEGKFAERRLRQYIGAMNDFATAFENHSLSAEEKTLVDTVKKHAADFEKTLADAQQKVSAVKQAEDFIGKAKDSAHGKVADVLGHLTAGTSLGNTLQAAGVASNAARQTQQRLAIEQFAAKAEKVTGKSLDSFFDRMRTVPAKAGAAARETAEKVGEVARKVPTGPILPTALELFQGKHATPEIAYTKRVAELQQANANYGQQIRHGANRAFGSLAADDPHAVNAAVVAATKGVQTLLAALPAGTINPKSLTPNASRPTPTRLEIQQYADVYQAVMKPLDVIKQIPSGTVSIPQMKAIRETSPALYGWLKQETIARLAKMDEDGIEVPVHAIDTLDTLLDLGDAAGPTYSASFAVKYSQKMGDVAAKARQPKPPKPSAKGSVGSRLSAGTSLAMMGGQ